MRRTTQPRSVQNPTSAASVTPSLATLGPTTRSLPVERRRKILLVPANPFNGGVQAEPLPAPLSTVVEQDPLLPLTGQDTSESDFIHVRPVPPDIKVSTLKSAMFYLPNAKLFMDKFLPDPEPRFCDRIVPNPDFSPDYFAALHSRVFAPGPSYPQGTYNYLGAKISLLHTNLKIQIWKDLLTDYPKKEIVDFLQFGFPIGVDPDGPTEPSLKNHSSSYMFYTYLDDSVLNRYVK